MMAQGGQPGTRALRPKDLDAVIEIDRRITGRTRRGFFEKRLEAAKRGAENFIVIFACDSGRNLRESGHCGVKVGFPSGSGHNVETSERAEISQQQPFRADDVLALFKVPKSLSEGAISGPD